MIQMEIDFQIPLFNDENWNFKNKEVIELYRKISNSRSLEFMYCNLTEVTF